MRNLPHLLAISLLALGGNALASSLRVNTTVVEYFSREPMAGARVRLYKDGALQPVKSTDRSGACVVELDNHATYVLRFDAPGFQTKCFTVDTHGMEWKDDRGRKSVDV